MPDVALLIDWENVYYTLRQHTTGPLPSSLAILQAILGKAAEFGPVRVKLAIFGQEVAAQDDSLLMALEFTGMEPLAVAQRMSGRLLKGRSDAVLITRAMRLLYKDRPDIPIWFIVSGDRDLNALCKALKDEDKLVYLVAGDLSLANELRESPYLRDDVFLLEDLIPQARWTRAGLRQDDTQLGKVPPPAASGAQVPGTVTLAGVPLRRPRGGRGRSGRPVLGAPAGANLAPLQPPVVPSGSPDSEKEQRRLAVLLLDQLVALRADSMPRGDFIQSVVPLSEKEASTVLEQRLDAAILQGHVVAKQAARTRLRAKQFIAPALSSPLVAETLFHLVRVLRRIDSVTSKDSRRIPAVEAVLDPLSRADQPGGLARGRTQRRMLLETLFAIAEERGAILTEQIGRDGKQITMCTLSEGHPLVAYARQPGAAIVHLFNFVHATKAKGDPTDWVNSALFAELLSRVEGDALEATLKGAVERGVMRTEEHGRKAGYVLVRTATEARVILAEFSALPEFSAAAGPAATPAIDTVAEAARDLAAGADDPTDDLETIMGDEGQAAPGTEIVKKAARRGSRGGRGHRGGRGRRRPGAGDAPAGDALPSA
ncbi:MAG: NYN domain-containing protein [Chloroflexi bacterium]|nr:NYN domain-containing protein [Chloroflexota bacterium]